MNVEIIPRKVFLDDRGWLFEMARLEEMGIPAKQITVSHIFPGAIKAFHRHEKQTDWVVCVSGNVKLITFPKIVVDVAAGNALLPFPEEVKFTYLGEKNPVMVKIPPGNYHGYTTLGNQPATIIYITDQTYDINDELRLDWNFLGADVWKIENK